MDFVDDADHLNHKYNLLMNRKMYEGADVENEDCGDQKEKRPSQMSPIHLCIFLHEDLTFQWEFPLFGKIIKLDDFVYVGFDANRLQ